MNANTTAGEKLNHEFMPLGFLQSVIRDAKTPAALQIKVAQAIRPYIRPQRSVRPKRPAIVADRHGFAVDRELARRLRNKVARISQLKWRRNPADQKLIVRLNLEMDQMTAALQCPCPSGYSMVQAGHMNSGLSGYGASAARAKSSPQSRMRPWRMSMRAIWLSPQDQKCRIASGWPS
jgi:hypothetical protein